MTKLQPLYGLECRYGAPFRCGGSAGKDTVLSEEGELDLAAIVNAPPPKMPLEPTLKCLYKFPISKSVYLQKKFHSLFQVEYQNLVHSERAF